MRFFLIGKKNNYERYTSMKDSLTDENMSHAKHNFTENFASHLLAV